jgi:hypothetical protein
MTYPLGFCWSIQMNCIPSVVRKEAGIPVDYSYKYRNGSQQDTDADGDDQVVINR